MASPSTQHDFLDPPQDDAGDSLGMLGHYKVLRELGKGGMGYVFLGEDVRLQRQVALKVMNKKIAATPGSRKRFLSEARSMAAVHHDNVATIFEVGEHNGTPYMAMELLRGSTLENYREEHGPPDYKQIIAFAKDIARGLAAAHEKGIVHRDIKPANIWLDTQTNRIKILDFGLALAQTPVDQLSGRGSVVGTPGYLSPEQARSEPLDDRSDLYSVGVVLYELACGSLPLKSKSVAEQLIAILAHAPQPLRERNDQIPAPLAELIHRLMAKEPRNRTANAKALLAELERAEVECEEKSEVAQAISQLQAGLDMAVKKKSGSSDGALAADDAAEGTPNPFESLPDAMPAMPPAATSASPSGMHPAATMPMATGGAPPARTSAPAAGGASSDNARKIIWIVIAVAALLLLITIPVAVYFSSTSAIARQQNQDATVIRQSGSRSPSPPTTSGSAAQERKPQPPDNPASQRQRATPAGVKRFAVTPIAAKEIEQLNAPGAKWLISTNQNNGSFEQTKVDVDQSAIPGWTLETAGSDAGWRRTPDVGRPDAKTFAYAGKKSELLLTSDLLAHETKAGDIFRLGLFVGGEGPGPSDYRIVVGFRSKPSDKPSEKKDPDDEDDLRYQLAELNNDAPWNRGPRGRLGFQFTAPPEASGKQPFVEVLVSNAKRARNRAMVDQIVLTVLSSERLADNKPQPNLAPAKPDAADPPSKPEPSKSDSSMVSVAKPVTERSEPMGPTKDTESTAKPARMVALKTSDEGGADATVRRGGSSKNPLGAEPALEIQTRNNAQIQHVYLRFPIVSLDGGDGNFSRNDRGPQGKRSSRPVSDVQLKLEVAEFKSRGAATIRVYGLDDAVSDVWPEDRLVWSNSLSDADLKGVALLAEQRLTATDTQVTFESDALNRFIANASQRSVTLILTGSAGNEWIELASKEDRGRSPPTLAVGLAR